MDQVRNAAQAAVAPPTPLPSTWDGVGTYLREIGRVPLLRAEEEILLSNAVQRGEEARRRLQHDGLSEEEERDLWRLILEGRLAADKMAEANLRLVVAVARQHMGIGMPLADLIQEGNLGLLKAITRYDPALECRFSTYAVYWIRQAIGRAAAEQGNTVRLPAHVAERVQRVRRSLAQLQQSLGRDPTLEELTLDVAQFTGDERGQVADCLADGRDLPEALARRWVKAQERVRAALRSVRQPLSLEAPVAEDGARSWEEVLITEEDNGPSQQVLIRLLKQALDETMQTLGPRERYIVAQRFGLEGATEKTLAELGEELGISRERVRQIEERALFKLRMASRPRRLSHYLSA